MTGDFKDMATILDKLIKSLGIEKKIHEMRAIELWPGVVGKRIASIARITKIENGVIFLNVANEVWRNELLFRKRQIIIELNKKLERDLIKDILFY